MSQSMHLVEDCKFCELISLPKISGLDPLEPSPHASYFSTLEAGLRLWPTISLVELGVRNLFSLAIQNYFGSRFFLEDLGVLTTKHLKRFPWFQKSQPATDTDAVISSLAMGFWADLTGRRYESSIWAPVLVNVLQLPSDVSREEFSMRLRQATILRNRIAHHESILKPRFSNAGLELRQLLVWISPDALEELDSFKLEIFYTP